MDAKESLIVSTQELLWQNGYVATSPRDILKHSGVGQGSMYHHFSGKAELAQAAIQRSAANLQAEAKKQLSVSGTAVDKLAAFLGRERDVLRGCPIGRLALDPEIIKTNMLRQLLEDAFEGVRHMLVEVIENGISCGELRADLDVDGTAELILSSIQGGYVLTRAAGSEVPFRKTIRGLHAILKTLEPR